jgi:PIN domain nuclease of toxin-antitoxin system
LQLLVDAHALIWWTISPEKLSARARQALSAPTNGVVVSVATLWEIAIKRSIGKLNYATDLETTLGDEGFGLLPLTFEHLRQFEALPLHHRDPFDRILAAQAIADGLAIVTADQRIAQYGAPVLW